MAEGAAIGSPGRLAPKSRRVTVLTGLYVAAIFLAELLLLKWSVPAGLTAHAVLAFALLTHYSLGRLKQGAEATAFGVFAAIAIVPVTRVVAAAIPLSWAPVNLWPGVAALPLLLGVPWGAKGLRATGTSLGFSFRKWPWQLAIGLAGAPLGYAAFLIAPPASGIESSSRLLIPVSIAVMLGGMSEEIIFRGILQRAMERSIGGAAVLGAGVLFSALYLGSQPLEFFIFMSGMGLLYGVLAWKTQSITGVCLSHTLMNVSLLLLPHFLP